MPKEAGFQRSDSESVRRVSGWLIWGRHSRQRRNGELSRLKTADVSSRQGYKPGPDHGASGGPVEELGSSEGSIAAPAGEEALGDCWWEGAGRQGECHWRAA